MERGRIANIVDRDFLLEFAAIPLFGYDGVVGQAML